MTQRQDLLTLVINLDRSQDRWRVASAGLNDLGFTVTRFPGVDGASPDILRQSKELQASTLRKLGRLLRPAEIGCFLSHMHAAQAIVASGQACGLVLEDDVDPSAFSLKNFDQILGWVDGAGKGHYDLINLGRPTAKICRNVLPLSGGNAMVRAFYFPALTHALLWSREGAERFLASARMDLPVDLFLQAWLSGSGRGFACRSALIKTTGVQSLIQVDKSATAKAGDPRKLDKVSMRLRTLRWKAENYFRAVRGLLRFGFGRNPP